MLLLHRDDHRIGAFGFEELGQLAEQSIPVGAYFRGLPVGGVRLCALLPACEGFVTFHTADGYSASLPSERVGECVIAYRLGVLPLPRRLGGPFRLVLDGNPRFCLKYLQMVELTREPGHNLLPACSHLVAAAEALRH